MNKNIVEFDLRLTVHHQCREWQRGTEWHVATPRTPANYNSRTLYRML